MQGKDIQIDWLPFELRPYPTPTLKPDGDFLQNAWRNSVYPLAQQLGVDIRLPSVSPQPYTRLAFEGLEFAKDHRRANEYNSCVMSAFFQKDRDIGSVDVLADVAAEAGLDAVEFRRALDSRHYEERVSELLRQGREMGITAVPLFMIGDRVLRGLQSKTAIERAPGS